MRLRPCGKFRLHRDGGAWWLDLCHSRAVGEQEFCSPQRKEALACEVVDAANRLLERKVGALIGATISNNPQLEGKRFEFLDYGLVMKRSHADAAAGEEFWLCGLQWGPIACWWETPRSQSVRQVLPPTAQVLQAMNRMLRAARDTKVWTDDTRVDVTLR